MTQYPPQPTGEWGEDPATPNPADQPQPPARSWWKRKRAIIPAAVVALFVGIAATSGGEEPSNVAEAGAETTVAPSVDATDEAQADEAEQAAAEEAERAEAEAAAEAERAAAEEAERAAAEEAERVAAEEAAAGTVSQQNAKRSAESYLDFTAFSHSGLIDQLEFEGFSTEDATWAVDRLDVDWNEQAAKSAGSYLEFSAFSRSGLIDQLLFEGFTQEQAEYGVDQTGL